jgi:two-component system response regulator
MDIKDTTILVVDDNPDEARHTLQALRKNNIGNKIIVVRDGMDALDYLFCQNAYANRAPCELPQLVLLDIELPRLGGMEVLLRIRSDERSRHLPVMMLTDSDEEHRMLESDISGANAFLRKPVDFTQFRKAIPQLGLSWVVVNEQLIEGG